jgi:hypothetical protein
MTERVDLDELEQIARAENAAVVVDVITELRVARRAIEACRRTRYSSIRRALAEYDQHTQPPTQEPGS